MVNVLSGSGHPLMDMNARRSDCVDEVVAWCSRVKYAAREVRVNYEFQKNGNKYLAIRREPACTSSCQ